jgi:uncharacterized protein (TIGR03435 family)
VCVIYWFHPLVWIARRLLAMANRQELARRVTAVLDPRQPRGRAGARVVAALSVASVVIVGVISPWRMSAAERRASTVMQAQPGQSSAARAMGAPQYEAASIKPCDPDASMAARRGGAQRINITTNRFYIQCVTVDSLIYVAYVRNGDYVINEHGLDQEVRGGADWIRSERFTLEATAAGKPDTSVLMGSMLRAFLEDRLQLRLHRVAEQIPMYALTVAKGGLKIKPMAEGDCTPDPNDESAAPAPVPAPGAGAKVPCGIMRGGRRSGLRIWDLTGASLRQLADGLDADRQVLDQTGVADKFNIHLEYAPEDLTSGADPAGPVMGVALEQQLGLKLISTKGPHEHVVVDHVERPSNK